MFFVLFWITTLISALLFVALTAALSGNLKGRRLNNVRIPCIGAFIIFMLGTTLTFSAYILRSEHIGPSWLFGYLLCLVLVFTLSSIYMLTKGLKGHKDSMPASTGWPRARIAAVFILILIFQGLLLWNEDRKVIKVFKEFKAEAVAYAEAITPPKLPDGQNAALIYEEVMVEFDDMPQWLYQYAKPNIDVDLSTEEIRAFLEEKKTALARIKEAASMPYNYKPLKLRYSEYLPTSFSNSRFAVYTQALRARVKASEGEIKAALEDIKTIDRFSEHVSQQPFITDTIIAKQSQSISTKNLEYILAVSDKIEPMDTLSVINEEDYIYNSILHAIEMELIIFMYNLPIGNETNNGIVIANSLYRVFFMPSEFAFARDRHKKVRQAYGRPLYEIKDAMEVWENSEDRIFGGILSSIAMIDYSRYIMRAIAAQAQQRLSNLALAATAYKADNGKYPASLDVFKGKYINEIPVDPFNGEPIRVKRVEGGMLLYSYGEDKADDKGTGDDITFSLGKAYFNKFKQEK